MRAAIFAGQGRLHLESRSVPKIEAADDVLIRVEACGLCGSDLQILAVPPRHPATRGIILGHEISGEVVEHGPAATVPEGLVVVNPDIACGLCDACRHGRPTLCSAMVSLGVNADGGFAEYCRAPAASVFRISSRVDPVVAAMTEPLAAVLSGLRHVGARIGDQALVIGGGPIGSIFLKALRASGVASVRVVEPAAGRRSIVEQMGATAAFSDVAAYQRAIDAGSASPADVVIDTVGRCLPDALQVVSDGGRILLFGIDETAENSIHQFEVTSREISIYGSVAASFSFRAAIQAIESKTIEFDDFGLIETDLGRIDDAVERSRTGQIMKAVVRPNA